MTLFEQPPSRGHGPPPTPRRRAGVLGWLAAVVAIAVFADAATGSQLAKWFAETTSAAVGGSAVSAPAADAVALADEMHLTEEGRRAFFEMQPEIVDAKGIERACSDSGSRLPDEEGWYDAGCFSATKYGGARMVGHIYILRPADPRAAEQMVTTGAHELLHAVYAQLGDSERAVVDGLVAAEVARIPAGDIVLEQIDSSTGGDESDRATEQFAYLGTEVMPAGGFTPQLEAIYARTFTDRAGLVDVYRRSGMAP